MAILDPFGDDIWLADGPAITSAGFRYPTRAAIIRLSDGGLFVWSPVELSGELRAAVNALGDVRFLVAPNSLHHVFLPQWKLAWPNARLYAAPGLRERRKDIAFDADIGAEPPQGWAGQIDQALMRGNMITTEAVFFHRRSRVVLFTDLLQHFEPGWFTGWRATVARLDRMMGSEPQVLQKFRVTFTNRKAARESLKVMLA